MRPSTAVAGGLAAAGVAVLLRLSAWQWERARTGGSLVNYTYAVEWMLLAVALVSARSSSGAEAPARPATTPPRGTPTAV